MFVELFYWQSGESARLLKGLIQPSNRSSLALRRLLGWAGVWPQHHGALPLHARYFFTLGALVE
jgi:hypothetical protein